MSRQTLIITTGLPLLLLVVVFTLARLLFLIFYWDLLESSSFFELLLGFISGLRFDLSALLKLFGLPYFLLLLSYGRLQKWVRWLFALWGQVALVAIIFIQGCDLVYYSVIGRRLSFEVLTLWHDVLPLFQLMFRDYPLPSSSGMVSMLICSVVWWKTWKFLFRLPLTRSVPSWSSWVDRVILLLLIIIAGRGGVQGRPLFQGVAFYDAPVVVGHLALNAPFTVMEQVSFRPLERYQWFSEKNAQAITRDLLDHTRYSQIYPLPKYPFYRKTSYPEGQTPEKMNVVMLILESWTARYIYSLGGTNPEVTPFFDSLSKQGRLFTRFFSNGTRSIEGIASMLISIPVFEDTKVVLGPFAQNSMTSLAAILRGHGYKTLFLHGGFKGTLGLHDFAKRVGFQKVIAKEDFEDQEHQFDGIWGIWDQYQFERFQQEIDQLPQPFYATLFSSSSHQPFAVPDERFLHFDKSVPDSKWLNSLRYSDWALEQFFEQAKKESWYQNTLFVITADHTIWAHRGRGNAFLQRGRIPLLLYTPSGKLTTNVDPIIGSHVDLTPTIINFLKLPDAHASMGKDLLSGTPGDAFAMFNSAIYVWYTDQFAYQFAGNELLEIYDFQAQILYKDVDLLRDQLIHQTNIQNYLGYLQTSHNALISNTIAPAHPLSD
ncbi:sulfatase-like hydrolase/transferase [Deltaproteobacteria bacterium TL4]